MYTSMIEFQFEPDSWDKALEPTAAMRADLEGLDGLKHFTVIDTDDDKDLVLAVYESQSDWEAAAPKAQELLRTDGRPGGRAAGAPGMRRSGQRGLLAVTSQLASLGAPGEHHTAERQQQHQPFGH